MKSIDVKHNGVLAKSILSTIRTMVRNSSKRHTDRVSTWRNNEEIFTGYIDKDDKDKIRKARNDNDQMEYAKIRLPYTYAVAMAAHSYWTSVFLARNPVFQYQGTNDAGEQSVLAVEALQQYQVSRGRQLPPFYIFFQDVPKYGEAWMMCYWDEEITRYATIEEVEDTAFYGLIPTGKTKKVRRVRQHVGYQGNKIGNIHPGKVFTDPRYPRNRFQEGDFVAVETTLSRMELLEGKETGRYINIDHVKPQQSEAQQAEEVHVEESNDPLNTQPRLGDFSTYDDSKATDIFKVYEVFVNLIPKQWGLGESGLPEKWVFTVNVYFNVLLECRPLGYMHNRYPLAYIEIEPEGYANFSRSLLEVFSPVQSTLDWLVNSHFFNVRQVLNNNMIFDPSRVYEKDLQSKSPGTMARLKPAAYGTDVRTAFSQLQTRDVTQTHLNDMGLMYDMGERLGISDTVMGMTYPASRRSATEARGDQGFGMSRLKTMSEYFSATGFAELGRMQLANSQQFYDTEKRLRVVGAAAQMASETFLNVTPDSIMGEYDLELVDGTLPIDRFAMVNLWQNLISQMAGVPQVVQRYDLGKIFGYVAQLGGIKNLNRFEVSIEPDDVIREAAARGETEPTTGDENTLEPGQIAGVGPTA